MKKIRFLTKYLGEDGKEIDTSNQEKRLIITMNFKDGTFDFLNCGPMEVRGKLTTPVLGDKKLIFFKRNRESFTAGVSAKSKLMNMTGEKITYKRYYLGWEITGKKVVAQSKVQVVFQRI